jgi:hypothetical protein
MVNGVVTATGPDASGSYEVGTDGRTDAWDGKIGLRVVG